VLKDATALGGVGHSTAPGAGAAARESVLSALGGRAPAVGDLVLVFGSASYDVEALHRVATIEAAPATVVGCTAFAAFTQDAQVTRGCVAAHVPAGGASFGVCQVERLEGDIAGSSRRAAETARGRAGERHPHSALLVLSDGLAGDQREVVRGAYEVTGSVIPLVGGTAGDDLRFERTHQFGPQGVTTNGLVAVWINSPRPLGVGVGHGWRRIGRPLLVTRAEGRVLHELDGRPAIQAYLEALEGRGDDDAAAFAAQVMSHPLGRPTSTGRYEISHVMHREGDALLMIGHVPEGSVVHLMASDEGLLLEGAQQAAREAREQLDGPPRAALAFSCAARYPLLGENRAEEASGVSRSLGNVPLAGFFTYGEFGRTVGPTGFHNATVSVLAL
jgi:hypothetical protein